MSDQMVSDEDVERLAQWVHLPGATNMMSEDRQVALNLLRRGVTLPPEPDTPAEPQERYYVDQREVHRHLVFTGDSKTERLVAECFTSDDAELVGSLLNLEAKHEDQGGVGKAIEQAEVRSRMRSAAMSRMEAELAEARAEVERLTALVREVAAAGVATSNRKYVEVQIDVDTWAELQAEIGEAPAAPQGDGPTEPPHEFQGHPGGVCTSCDCQMETGNHLRPTEPQIPWVPLHEAKEADMATEPLFTGKVRWVDGLQAIVVPDDQVQYIDNWPRVAVFPLGAGPTNQPVTAEMVYEAIEAAGVRDGLDRGDGPAYIRPCDWTTGETSVVADALNVQLGRTPAPQPTTREQVLRAIEQAAPDSHDEADDARADAVMLLLGQTEAE